MPKDKCIVCGKPCVGRFCRQHLCEALDRSRVLYETDRTAWKVAVDHANKYTYPPKRDNAPATS